MLLIAVCRPGPSQANTHTSSVSTWATPFTDTNQAINSARSHTVLQASVNTVLWTLIIQ